MILYFSGTGNTAWVADRLSATLGESRPVEIARHLLDSKKLDLTAEKRIIWAFPVYAWGIPTTVERFIRDVDLGDIGQIPHYMVATCGDDTGNIDRQWRRIIRSRSWRDRGCWSVTMPNTYTAMRGFDVDSPEVAGRKLADAPRRVDEIGSAIEGDSDATDILRGRFPGLKSGLIRAWFHRFAMSPARFRVGEGCISCGKCERACPTSNIVLVDGRPEWSDDCALCLACYHHCPVHAINYGRATQSKGQYVCPLRLISKK